MPKTIEKKNTAKNSPKAEKAKVPTAKAGAAKEKKQAEAPPKPPSQAAALAKAAGLLPTTLVAIDQLEPHPKNEEWRQYPVEEIANLADIIENRPEDVPANPLQAVPSGKKTADGRPLYHVISGCHRLGIYKQKGFEAAPVQIREGLSDVEQILVMLTSNRGRNASQLEIGLNYRLFVEACGGERDYPGPPNPGDERKATKTGYAHAIGIDPSYMSYCNDAAEMFQSFSPEVQHKINLAGQRFTGRHFRALKKLRGAARERFAAWAVADAPNDVVGSDQLMQAIRVYKKEDSPDEYVKATLGDVMKDPGTASSRTELFPDGKAAAGGTGAISVGAGSRRGKVTDGAAEGVNEGAYKKATEGVTRIPTDLTPEERLTQFKMQVESNLMPGLASLFNGVAKRMYGEHQKIAQELVIEFLKEETKRWKNMELRLNLEEDNSGNGNGAGGAEVEGTEVPEGAESDAVTA